MGKFSPGCCCSCPCKNGKNPSEFHLTLANFADNDDRDGSGFGNQCSGCADLDTTYVIVTATALVNNCTPSGTGTLTTLTQQFANSTTGCSFTGLGVGSLCSGPIEIDISLFYDPVSQTRSIQVEFDLLSFSGTINNHAWRRYQFLLTETSVTDAYGCVEPITNLDIPYSDGQGCDDGGTVTCTLTTVP